MVTTFSSIDEVQRELFPNRILDRLEERMNDYLDLGGKTLLNKSKENPRTGFLELGKPWDYMFHSEEDVRAEIKSFYEVEGFVLRDGSFVRGRERYSVGIYSLMEGEFWVVVR